MAEAHAIEREATEFLRRYLKAQGRRVEPSDNKTFDLVVDGRYAEVKAKAKRYSEFDFFYMSEKLLLLLMPRAGVEPARELRPKGF